MKKVILKQVKNGDYFRLRPTEKAPVWVRGDYERDTKKYECYRYDNVNYMLTMKGTREVYVDFEF